jgi:hypothetical protein
MIQLSPQSLHNLEEYFQALHTWDGRAILPSPTNLILITDASGLGWGAHLGHLRVEGLWNTEEEFSLSINFQEMKAVLLTLRHFLPVLRGKALTVMSDNITTVAYLNKFSGRRDHLFNLT